MIEEIALGLVQLRVRDDWRRWVPLLQVEAIDGEEVPTAKWLERPAVAGVVRVPLAYADAEKLP